jgi:hypothetical protein
VVEDVGESCRVVAVGTGVTAFGCVAEVGWGCFGGIGAREEALASTLSCKGSQQCTRALQVLSFLGLCVASVFWPIGLLPISS